MKKVVSINRKKEQQFPGFSAFTTKRQSNFENGFLLAGAIISFVVLQIICAVNGEGIQSILFIGSAVVGCAGGLAIRLLPHQTLFSINLQNVPKGQPKMEIKLPKAA